MDKIIYLAVNDSTGEVDYGYLEYALSEAPQKDDPESFLLIKGWSWKPFKIVPADAT